MTTINMPMSEAMKRVTLNIKITGLRRFKARMFLATLVFKLGAMVAGCGVTIADEDDAK